MTYRLELFNFGYVFYIVDADTCATMAIPKVAVVPHVAALAIERANTSVDGSPALIAESGPDDELLLIDISGLTLTCPETTSAQLRRRPNGASMDVPDFDWIPDFSETCGGVELNGDWRRVAAASATFEFGGGTLEALADFHTCDGTWTWTLPNGQAHTQRVTTLTRYVLESSQQIVLTMTPRGGGPTIRVSFSNAAATAYLLNVPGSFLDQRVQPEPGGLVELGHVTAGLSFCAPTGQPIAVIPKTRQLTPCRSVPGAKAAALLSLGPFHRLGILHDGTTECSSSCFRWLTRRREMRAAPSGRIWRMCSERDGQMWCCPCGRR